jgi:hypothetical protein
MFRLKIRISLIILIKNYINLFLLLIIILSSNYLDKLPDENNLDNISVDSTALKLNIPKSLLDLQIIHTSRYLYFPKAFNSKIKYLTD